ncbi:MAG: hypothetical protein WD648_16490 [Planctomycetaceae bacterium]
MDPHSTSDHESGDAGDDDFYSDPNYWLEEVNRVIAEVRAEYAAAGGPSKHLITVDELRAAGALDVPAEWRKSLGKESRHLLPGFDDDEDAESQSATQADSERDESADELS